MQNTKLTAIYSAIAVQFTALAQIHSASKQVNVKKSKRVQTKRVRPATHNKHSEVRAKWAREMQKWHKANNIAPTTSFTRNTSGQKYIVVNGALTDGTLRFEVRTPAGRLTSPTTGSYTFYNFKEAIAVRDASATV